MVLVGGNGLGTGEMVSGGGKWSLVNREEIAPDLDLSPGFQKGILYRVCRLPPNYPQFTSQVSPLIWI